MPEFGRLAVTEAVGLLHKNLGKEEPVPDFKNLPDGLKFVLIVLILERICYAACDMLTKAINGNS
jgi:hypothetical protein